MGHFEDSVLKDTTYKLLPLNPKHQIAGLSETTKSERKVIRQHTRNGNIHATSQKESDKGEAGLRARGALLNK